MKTSNKYFYSENDNYKFLKSNSKIIIHEKNSGDTYENINSETIYHILKKNYFYEVSSKINIKILIFLLLVSIIFLLLMMSVKVIITLNVADYWFIILFLVSQIVLHEIAHYFVLKTYKKNITKFGFKMVYYIFPAIFIRSNEVNLLIKKQKLLYYSIGVIVNSIIITTIYLCYEFYYIPKILIFSNLILSKLTLFNFLPILGSDGCKFFSTLLNLSEFEKFSDNHFIQKTIIILSSLICIVYIINIIKTIF